MDKHIDIDQNSDFLVTPSDIFSDDNIEVVKTID